VSITTFLRHAHRSGWRAAVPVKSRRDSSIPAVVVDGTSPVPYLVSWPRKYPVLTGMTRTGQKTFRTGASSRVYRRARQHEQDNHLAHNSRFDLTPGSIP
jgi:hypothetical protein